MGRARASADVIIVGGGLWGLSTAYHLLESQAGLRVLLLERNSRFGCETTAQAAGQVGQLRTSSIMVQAIQYTLQLLGAFPQLTGHDPGFVNSGSLHLALCEARERSLQVLGKRAGLCGAASEWLDPAQIAGRVPDVWTGELVGGLWLPGDGYVDSHRYAQALLSACRSRGAVCEPAAEVRMLRSVGNSVQVSTPKVTYVASQVLVAAGPWTDRLTAFLPFRCPCFPVRLQQARTEAAGVPPWHPVVRIPDVSCYVRPEERGYLYGFFDPEPLAVDLDAQPDSFRTADLPPDSSLVVESQGRLARIFPQLRTLKIAQYRQGLITCTPDGKFLLGPLPEFPGVWVATGCGGTGVAVSGAVGRWLARWILSGHPGDDLTEFAPQRFHEQAGDKEWLRASCCETAARYYRLEPVERQRVPLAERRAFPA